ncbi:TonB-dependent receptor plug domain-containing protein [Phenylobacterium sp.]|uniref:TonB-dependent receptor plug domain-containing protein n=1 Tax=Phenylobacterium sp. TaxID=1871053 RepID=UPI00260EA909|nr:TonB-dependent receptor plug domain-containing protein [Phenylobacterium sp.]
MSFLLALAQAAAPAAAPATTPQQGLTSYPAAYFAGATTGTALDMVNRLPDFVLDTGSSVRGFEGAAGNVLVNGERPASKSDALDAILQRIPAAKVERIDVVRGGAPGIDMQGKTVIANLVLKRGGGAHAILALANQHVNDGRNLGGVRLEGSGALTHRRTWEASLHVGKGPDDGVGPGHNEIRFADGRPPFVARINTAGTDLQGQFTAAVETPLMGGRLRLNTYFNQEKFKEPEQDLITSPGSDLQSFDFIQKTYDAEGGARYSRSFGPNTTVELMALRTSRHRKTDSSSADADPSVAGSDASDDFFNLRSSSELILRAVLKQRFGATLSLEAGSENADNKLESHTSFAVDGAPQSLPAANVRVEEKRTESFVKLAWRPISAITVDADLAYESSDLSSRGDVVLGKSLQFAKPRLAVTWNATRGTQLRLRLERVVGQLNFDDFVASSSLASSIGVTAGNPNLNPEQDWVGEAAIEQQLWRGSSLILTVRHFKITDAVDRGPVFAADGSVFDQPTNIGSGTKDEVEATGTLRFDSFGWKGALLKFDVVERWSHVTDPTTHQLRAISNLHPLDWSVNFNQDLPRYNASVGFDLFGGFQQRSYRFNLIENFKLQTFAHPFAEWRPRPDLSLRAELPLINHPHVRLRDEFLVFPGPRSRGGTPDVQERTFTFPYSWYFRIRKEIG